jgi:hypothetical protein
MCSYFHAYTACAHCSRTGGVSGPVLHLRARTAVAQHHAALCVVAVPEDAIHGGPDWYVCALHL